MSNNFPLPQERENLSYYSNLVSKGLEETFALALMKVVVENNPLPPDLTPRVFLACYERIAQDFLASIRGAVVSSPQDFWSLIEQYRSSGIPNELLSSWAIFVKRTPLPETPEEQAA